MGLNPAKFVREVQSEATKVTWPTRNETVVTTIMVLIMVTLAALFFFSVDWTVGHIIRIIFGFGG